MNRIRPLRFIRTKSNSLFLRLVASFLFIIVLLASLTSYAVSVSKSNVKHEIVKYNTLMLNNTTDNYEKHFEIIKQQMYLFFFSDRVQQLQRAPKYSNFPDVIKEILNLVSNPNLYINNIVIYSKKNNFILEKGTSTTPDTMFNAFMASENYSLDFWNRKFDETYTNRIYPADHFYLKAYRGRSTSVGELIPIVFKQAYHHDFYIVVFLDAGKMYEAFRQSIDEDLIIYNELGETIFKRTDSETVLPLDAVTSHAGNEFISDDKYHFHTTAADTGMTYLKRLPVAQMASQTRLNFTMVAVIAAVVAFSILISLLFAARINNPFKKLIDSIRRTGDTQAYSSSIQEFDLIGRQLKDKQKLQKQWAFIHHLKNIRQENDTPKLEFSNRPFVFVLFQVIEKKSKTLAHGIFQSWLYYMKVFIEDKLNRSFPEALTFQIEYNQILSLVFVDRMEDLHHILAEMKSIFDQDRDSGTITIAVTSQFDHSNQMSEAYREVLERVGERSLIDETQIVASPPVRLVAFGFTQDQDIQFRANLKEGNTDALCSLIDRFFARWQDERVPAKDWQQFAEGVADSIRQTASSGLVSPSRLNEILINAEEKISRCVTSMELQHLLRGWATRTADAIGEKIERKDPITSFVMEFVNDNMADDIYLDVLAEKLNLSSGYLSTYFKEKTGINIVEYVNETRIRKAASLLMDSRLKIKEIAEAVGYRNITSFNRMFKKYTGLKPSEYRNSGIIGEIEE